MRLSALPAVSLALLLLLGGGCSGRKGDKVISESKMVDLLTDLQIAEAYSYRGDPDKERTTRGILAYYGVTQEEMDSTLAWYGRNLDDYRDLYRKVDRKLAAKMKNVTGSQEAGKEDGNLWQWPVAYRFQPGEYNDGLTFSIPSPSLAPGSQVEFAYRSPRGDTFEVMLGVDYADGTSSYKMMNRGETGRQRIVLQTDSSKNVTRLFGFLRMPAQPASPVALDSLSLVTLPMNPNDYYQIKQQRTLMPQRRSNRRGKEEADTISVKTDSIKLLQQNEREENPRPGYKGDPYGRQPQSSHVSSRSIKM